MTVQQPYDNELTTEPIRLDDASAEVDGPAAQEHQPRAPYSSSRAPSVTQLPLLNPPSRWTLVPTFKV